MTRNVPKRLYFFQRFRGSHLFAFWVGARSFQRDKQTNKFWAVRWIWLSRVWMKTGPKGSGLSLYLQAALWDQCFLFFKGAFSHKHQGYLTYTLWSRTNLRIQSGIEQIIIINIIFFLYKTFRTRRLQKTGVESPGRIPSPRKPTKTSQIPPHFEAKSSILTARKWRDFWGFKVLNCCFRGEGRLPTL